MLGLRVERCSGLRQRFLLGAAMIAFIALKVFSMEKKWIAIGIIDSKEKDKVVTYLDDSPYILCYHDNGEIE